MKIILSRKGIDGGTGKRPSPLIKTKDGWVPVSIPIPGGNERRTYGEVTVNGRNLGKLVADLGVLDKGGKPATSKTPVHFDPDLEESSVSRRPKGWLPLFGQCNAALGHLEKQDVTENDLFLFFGRFRKARFVDGVLDFIPDEPEVHALFGWLQIGEVFCKNKSPEWATGHPHVNGDKETARYGTVYASSSQLNLAQIANSRNLAGAGAFRRFTDSAQLTYPAPDASQHRLSRWKLPPAFFPDSPLSPLTYHSNLGRWTKHKDHTELNVVARGQEFVLDLDPKKESGSKPFPSETRKAILRWVFEVIKTHA